jgi:hypothetical protein
MDPRLRRAMTLAASGEGAKQSPGASRVAERISFALFSVMPGLVPGIQWGGDLESHDWIAGTSPAMTNKSQKGDLMGKAEIRAADLSRDLRLAAELLEIWRLCGKSRCRRARACHGDPRVCCNRLADLSDSLSRRDKRVSFEEAMQRLRDQSP